MSTSLTGSAERLLRAASDVGGAVMQTDVEALSDTQVTAALRDAAAARHAADVVIAALSAEVDRRSTRSSGTAGLAQREGHRNATSLVQSLTGQTRADVGRALRTGHDLAGDVFTARAATSSAHGEPTPDADTTDPDVGTPTWTDLLQEALLSGRIGQAQYQAIRVGLGEPPIERYPDVEPGFLPRAWALAVVTLLDECADTPVEDVRAAARTARDRLDPIGTTLRFEERFAGRSFRMWIDENGQQHARIAFDDEAAAWVTALLSASLRPRRGPRFVEAGSEPDPDDRDDRTNEQLQYDTVIAVLRTGAAADPHQAFGDRQPGVRLIVEQTATTSDDDNAVRVVGVGHAEDGGAALPGGVIEARLCDAGSVRVTLDAAGRPLDVGREHRLFTRKQRIAIGTREGGCIGPNCTAPTSWCEYHHVDHWSEHSGRTDVDDGVPLCRNCHLRLHNQGARIRRRRHPETGADTYSWHAPPDPVTGVRPQPIPLRSRSPRRFLAG